MTTELRQRTLDPQNLDTLRGYLRFALGADAVDVPSAQLLSGGAVQENWRISLSVTGGEYAGDHDLVLRTDASARLPISLDRTGEFQVVKAADVAGVSVARPIHECADATVIGAPFTLQSFVTGTASPRALVRDPDVATWGADAAFALGRELAKIHAITPESDAASKLGFLPHPLASPAKTEVQRLRHAIDGSADPRPALEFILSWLDAHAPRSVETTLVHGDFRTGNILLERAAVSAVLDWEFAHWGDPAEDLGWFCARCWRFGRDDMEAGGLGPRKSFYNGYQSISALPLGGETVPYWEIMAAAKWAAVSVLQGDRYRRGGEDALELVLTGLMTPEMELDALLQIETLSKSLPR